jgi:hypothetical protein
MGIAGMPGGIIPTEEGGGKPVCDGGDNGIPAGKLPAPPNISWADVVCGGLVPKRMVAAAVVGPTESELAADVTSLGDGTGWNGDVLRGGGICCCDIMVTGGGRGIVPTIGDVTAAGIMGTTMVGMPPI